METKKLTISIALCSYNGESYIKEQLESIANQSRLPYEMIICDDNSKDKTIEIIKTFASKVPFNVQIFKNTLNLGSTKNFEKAIGLCEGDVIVLSDQDDVWESDKLSCIENEFIRSIHVGAVFTNGELVDKKLKLLGSTLWEFVGFDKKLQRSMKDGKSFKILLNHNIVTGATLAFRKEYTKLLLPIPSSWIHDAWIALLIACTAHLIFTPKKLIKYRVHSNQQIGVEKRNFLRKFEYASNKTRQTYIDEVKCLKTFLKRVSSHGSIKKDYLRLINMKIYHLKVRANLPQQKLTRIVPILNEMLRFNYHRYSHGLKSVITDLFIRRI